MEDRITICPLKVMMAFDNEQITKAQKKNKFCLFNQIHRIIHLFFFSLRSNQSLFFCWFRQHLFYFCMPALDYFYFNCYGVLIAMNHNKIENPPKFLHPKFKNMTFWKKKFFFTTKLYCLKNWARINAFLLKIIFISQL